MSHAGYLKEMQAREDDDMNEDSSQVSISGYTEDSRSTADRNAAYRVSSSPEPSVTSSERTDVGVPHQQVRQFQSGLIQPARQSSDAAPSNPGSPLQTVYQATTPDYRNQPAYSPTSPDYGPHHQQQQSYSPTSPSYAPQEAIPSTTLLQHDVGTLRHDVGILQGNVRTIQRDVQNLQHDMRGLRQELNDLSKKQTDQFEAIMNAINASKK